MFTGLVEAIGTVRAIVPHEATKRFVIEAPFASDVKLGDSICVDGACQTVVAHEQHTFAVEAIPETLKRTKFGDYKVGQKLNLERALQLSDRLSGHVVQGHIDCTGRIAKMHLNGEERIVTVEFPSDYAALIVEKGSIAIDGVSLTVVDANTRTFTVALIPHTWEATTLGEVHTGDRVNLEFDLIAKYILRFKQVGATGVRREIAGK